MKRRTIAGYLFALVTGCGTQSHVTPDAGTGCGTYAATPSDAGCAELCQAHGCPTGFCSLGPTDAGTFVLECFADHTGRRPAGLLRATAGTCCATGHYFALAAHLEAASVTAFDHLAAELASFGAPMSLRRAAARCARDERRHARVMARLARQHGATMPAVRIRPHRPRSLERFARDNAIEGCVKETYGAALALHQSMHADARDVRTALAAIARDERRHAELAWQIDAWVATRLTSAARARVERVRAGAARRLHRRELRSADHEVARALGLPSRERRCDLSQALVVACARG